MLLTRIGILALVLVTLIVAPHARAQQSVQGIAAVINDEVISVYDVWARLQIVISSSDLPNTPQTQQRLIPQVLRGLIDEKLQIQEAKRLGVEATASDLKRAKADLEKQNKLAPGTLGKFLAARGVDENALEQQLKATMSWSKVRRIRLRKKFRVGDDEINEAMARIKANKGKPEHLAAEIFLPVDNPREEQKVREIVARLLKQIKAGADFPALAKSFSKSASASSGGSLGWVIEGQLDPELEAALNKMEPGQIAGPVRTLSGFHILLLRKRRQSAGLLAGEPLKVNLQQTFLPLTRIATNVAVAEASRRLTETTKDAKSCADLDRIGKDLGTTMSGSLGTLEITKLPARFQQVLAKLPDLTPSPPVRTEQGMVVLMVCSRSGGTSEAMARDRVKNMLLNKRADKAAQRLMRDLRRDALVDIRL
ncbi:putative Peptidyl-prolyl cis-trans isomerase family protein surA [Magnetospira sp. QH-2]|nr:putative Peptidyl-prolyl cis-trans isomerase family protein surA [Magnetospira sp. QH-2]